MNRNRRIALAAIILAFLAGVWMLDCSKEEKPKPDKDKWYRDTNNPKPPPQQPPDCSIKG